MVQPPLTSSTSSASISDMLKKSGRMLPKKLVDMVSSPRLRPCSEPDIPKRSRSAPSQRLAAVVISSGPKVWLEDPIPRIPGALHDETAATIHATICFGSRAKLPVEGVCLDEIVALNLQFFTEKVREVWGGRLLLARRVPASVTAHAVLSVLFYLFMFLTIVFFTFSMFGPVTAVLIGAWFIRETTFQDVKGAVAAAAAQSPELTPEVKRPGSPAAAAASIPALLSWWCDFALWWCFTRLASWVASSRQSFTAAALVYSVAVAIALSVLDLLHGKPHLVFSGWRQGGFLKVHAALTHLKSPRYWHEPRPPLFVDFLEQDLPELLALRVALMKAGYKDLLLNIWIGNFVTETALSVVLPSFLYNSQRLRRVIHVILDLCMPLFFCFQAIHILMGGIGALELSRRLGTDPFVKGMLFLLNYLLERTQLARLGLLFPMEAREFLFNQLILMQKAWDDVVHWMSQVAMPVDYAITYIFARMTTVRTSLAPIAWGWLTLVRKLGDQMQAVSESPAWLFLQEKLIWGLPKFGGLGWWRRVGEFFGWTQAAIMHLLPPQYRFPMPDLDQRQDSNNDPVDREADSVAAERVKTSAAEADARSARDSGTSAAEADDRSAHGSNADMEASLASPLPAEPADDEKQAWEEAPNLRSSVSASDISDMGSEMPLRKTSVSDMGSETLVAAADFPPSPSGGAAERSVPRRRNRRKHSQRDQSRAEEPTVPQTSDTP